MGQIEGITFALVIYSSVGLIISMLFFVGEPRDNINQYYNLVDWGGMLIFWPYALLFMIFLALCNYSKRRGNERNAI